MNEAHSTIVNMRPRRGKGPGVIMFADGTEVSTFDSEMIRLAASHLQKEVTYSWIDKTSKDGSKVYRNLVTLSGPALESPEASTTPPGEVQDAPGSTNAGLAIPDQRVEAKVLSVGRVEPLSAIFRLEQGFALAVRQRELLENFIKRRFKVDVHFMDGKVFGSAKPVLLQPGAQLILYCHGLSVEFDVTQPPPAAPSDSTPYFVTVKALIKNQEGRIVGTAIGSAGSHIWSGRQARHVLRAPDSEKAMNTALKIAQKRALVSACNNGTASSEFFTVDLDTDSTVELEHGTKSNKFIK